MAKALKRSKAKDKGTVGGEEKEAREKEKEEKRKLNEGLKSAIERRKRFVEHVGGMFKMEEKETPGRFYGLPTESVFKGLTVEEDKA